MQTALKRFAATTFVPRAEFSKNIASNKSKLIKDSLPVLEKHAEDLTNHFYKTHIFPKNIPFFNKINEKTGR